MKTSLISNHRSHCEIDFKAEIIYLSLLDFYSTDDEININFKGKFFRGFRKDKLDLNYDILKKNQINLDISRDGFYDILPEGFIHNQYKRDLSLTPTDEFKIRKKEEKEARHFFNPLENEFFRSSSDIENYESTILSNLNADGLASIIRKILSIDHKIIPDNFVVKMYFFLIDYNKKDQNFETICQILESITGEKVTYYSTRQIIKDQNLESNNELVLGVNTTLDSNKESFLKKIHFEVGPLKNSTMIEEFFEGKKMKVFFDTFFDLFLPIHFSYEYTINLNLEDKKFEFGNSNYKSRLGISTVI